MQESIDIVEYMATSLTSIKNHVQKKYPGQEWVYEAQRYYWASACEAKQKGIPVVWHNQSIPPELLYAMGVVPLCLDVLSTSLAAFHALTPKYLDIAHKYVPEYVCEVNKIVIGIVMSGDIPLPDAIIYASGPCDSSRISYPMIAQSLNVPYFCVDAPFQDNDSGHSYIAGQLKEGLAFLEQVTGKRLDWSSMADVIEQSNLSYGLFGQIAELRKTTPCPLPGKLLTMNSVALGMSGTPQLVDYLKKQQEQALEKIEKKEGRLADEKRRVAWIQNPIFFNIGILDWMEKEFGAIVPMDAFGWRKAALIKDVSDKEAVFKGLAKRSLMVPMTHMGSSPVEYWMQSATELFRDYKCNTAIFAGHVGCTHFWAVGKLLKDMIYDNFGVTTLVFDVDALDPRYVGTDIIQSRIRDFMETVK
jgi:benzoyl-CoA reductase/2-hydroxyglutaryl-CoA dehydratase subunit BcrC/BadD/HgdB